MVDAGYLVVTLADGSVTRQALPGMGGSEDRTARDAAAAAQGTADGATTSAANAQAEIDAHEANHPSGGAGVDQTARDAAAAAQADLDAHESSIHNTDQTARAAAASAQGAIADHERAPHNTDTTARTAASAAQARADDAFALADEKVDPAGAASAAREVTVDWAEAENPDPIPAPKLVNVVNAHEDIVNVLDGRLPGLPVADAVGLVTEGGIYRGGFCPAVAAHRRFSIAGLSDGLAAPPFPPSPRVGPDVVLGTLVGRRSRRCGD